MEGEDGHWDPVGLLEVFSAPIPALTFLGGILFWGSLLLKITKILTISWVVLLKSWVIGFAILALLIVCFSTGSKKTGDRIP
jgi:hypothetical protein